MRTRIWTIYRDEPQFGIRNFMLIALTRLRVRSALTLPRFVWYSLAVSRQAKRVEGFSGGKLLVDSHRTFWTMTAWQNPKQMHVFMASGDHRRVMPYLASWCDEASVAHWNTETDELPDWIEAHRRMVGEGRASLVNRPSPRHEKLDFPQPRIKPRIERILRP